MKKWIIAICILVTSGIIFYNIKADDEALGEDYYYLPLYEAIDVGFPEGAVIYKSSQKYVFSDIKIHGEVITVNHNKDFIIATQQKKDSSDINRVDSSIGNNTTLQYFIIVKKSGIVYGPFKKEEYLQKREELKIPKELELKE